MSISVVCSGCNAKLNAPDGAAGKKVKCPKCQNPIAIPAAKAAEPDFDVVEDDPAAERQLRAVAVQDHGAVFARRG